MDYRILNAENEESDSPCTVDLSVIGYLFILKRKGFYRAVPCDKYNHPEIPSPRVQPSRQGGHSCFPKGTALKVTANTAYFEVEMKKKGIKMEDSLHTITKDHFFIP